METVWFFFLTQTCPKLHHFPSDTHLTGQAWSFLMWNQEMRACTPARSSLNWIWLKPAVLWLYVVSFGYRDLSVIVKCTCMNLIWVLLSPDRPDPPVHLQVTNAKHRVVTLSWTPGDDNNSPILGLVQSSHKQIWHTVHVHICHFYFSTLFLL